MERSRRTVLLCSTCALAFSGSVFVAKPAVATTNGDSTANRLKALSLDELLNVEVTSVSRQPEKLTQAASAIQVILQEDIKHSAATSIAEALRLAPNLQVAQVNGSQWAISARGFNNVLANKLLVMIDGRTVYTPLYAGVFWDAQDTVLEDIDRIEVVSGPGGTLWGANAVNGVINVTTQSAKYTQGLLITGSAGDELTGDATIRYGGKIGSGNYRVYAKATSRDDTTLLNGADALDAWHRQQGGFRTDWEVGDNSFTAQGDVYSAEPNPDGATPVASTGSNVLGRWKRVVSASADMQLQLYYDYTRRDFGNGFVENLKTYDLDWQHRFHLGDIHEIIWGADYRYMQHDVSNLPLFAFVPGEKTLPLYGVFLQDEMSFFDKQIRVTIGSKFGHNYYTGWEIQPNGRIAWTPNEQHTIWAAISQAVRTPARIDRDFYLALTPTIPVFVPGEMESEKVTAYELGWRVQPQDKLSISLSTYFNEYDDLRSAEPGTTLPPLPFTLANGVEGQTYGVELALTYKPTDYWKLRGGYNFLIKHLAVKPTSRDANNASAESDDPENQAMLQSTLSVAKHFDVDCVLRYVDQLPKPTVANYVALDVRLAWTPTQNLEFALVGQNLLDDRHPEFVPASPSPREIERGFYGKVTWRN